MDATATVFVIDDDDAVRESLSLYLEHKGLRVEGYARARTFLDAYQPERPGCLVLDLRMPGMTGSDLQAALLAKGFSIPVIFITGHGDIKAAVRAVKAGAIDFLEKPFKNAELLKLIKEALSTDARTREHAAWSRTINEQYASLTPREREVMALIVAGFSNKEIARQFQGSPRTVDVHRAKVMRKMQAGSLSELVAIAVAGGIHEPEPASERSRTGSGTTDGQ